MGAGRGEVPSARKEGSHGWLWVGGFQGGLWGLFVVLHTALLRLQAWCWHLQSSPWGEMR